MPTSTGGWMMYTAYARRLSQDQSAEGLFMSARAMSSHAAMRPQDTNGSQKEYIIAGQVCPPPKLALPGGKTRMAIAMLMGMTGHAAASVMIQGRACPH